MPEWCCVAVTTGLDVAARSASVAGCVAAAVTISAANDERPDQREYSFHCVPSP